MPAAWGAGCGALASPQAETGQPSSAPGPAGAQELFWEPGVRAGAAPDRAGLASRPVPGVSPCWSSTSCPSVVGAEAGLGWAGRPGRKPALSAESGCSQGPFGPSGPCRAEGREAGPEFVLHSELSQLWSFSSRAQSSRCGWCLSFLKTPSIIEGPVLGDASTARPCAGSGSPSQAGGRQVG